MKHYFIIEFEAMKNCNLTHERCTMMYQGDSLESVNNFIVRIAKSYFEEQFERVFVKIWKWENGDAAFMVEGVIRDYDTETIFI